MDDERVVSRATARKVRVMPANGSSRLSPLDASFLEVETPTAHMHVGWVALFDPPAEGPAPAFPELRRHIESRLSRAPRYRQKLAFTPFGLHDPVWVDDPAFDVRRHVKHSASKDIDRLTERVFSTPLSRDRSLWELWVGDQLEDGRLAVVGKAHHCMVDGIATVELASLFLDAEADPPDPEPDDWIPAPPPGNATLLGAAIRDRVRDELDLLRLPARVVRSPGRIAGLPAGAGRAARSLFHSVMPAPASVFNQPISPLRCLARSRRPMAELVALKERFGATINDVVLTVAAGGFRRYLQKRGETPHPLKTMVPVSVRAQGDASDLGNQVAFLFIELPSDEPDPVRRLENVQMAMRDRKEAGEPRGFQAILEAVRYTPHRVQHAVSQVIADQRTFNVVVSNIPGPRDSLYMMGCPLREAYPIVPLADDHGVAIGFTSVCDNGCFGVYADRKTVPDAALLAGDIDASIDELKAARRGSS
jgi:diacylglycerol O-acyltransferase / wax synthase